MAIDSKYESSTTDNYHAEANIRDIRILGFRVTAIGKHILDVIFNSVAVLIYIYIRK